MKNKQISQSGTFTDSRDGRSYKCAQIGTQIWMAENLDYSIGVSVYYNNDEKYKEYGRLYNWLESISAAPDGWHLPSNEEWQTLVNFVGGDKVAGKKLKATSGWNNNGNGTDEFGFSALPGGYGSCSDGKLDYVNFNNIDNLGRWWSSFIKKNSNIAFSWYIYYSTEYAYPCEYNTHGRLSVRCIKD
jgi:uncharacterized protein (TIGR02145 family)